MFIILSGYLIRGAYALARVRGWDRASAFAACGRARGLASKACDWEGRESGRGWFGRPAKRATERERPRPDERSQTAPM